MFFNQPGRNSDLARVVIIAALIGVAVVGCGPTTTPVPTSQPTATVAVPPQETSTPSEATATSAQIATATVAPDPTPTAQAAVTPGPGENPANYQWKQAGLAGNNVTDLALYAGGTNVVLAAGPKGAWLSSYDYTQWQPLGVKLDVEGRRSEASIASQDVMYVTSNTGCASGLPSTRSRSTDGGKTWQEISNEAMTISGSNGGVAYAATCSSVLKSTDSGATWTELPGSSISNYDILDLTASPDGELVYVAYASEGGTGRIQMSSDGGQNWQEITPVTPESGEFVGPGNLFLVTGSEGRPQDGALYLTTAQGLWMVPLESTEWKLMKNDDRMDTLGSGYNITALYVDTAYSDDYNKTGPVIYTARAGQGKGEQGAVGLGVFRSTNGGMTWEVVGTGLEQRTVNSMVLAPHDPTANPIMLETLLAATDDGLWAAPIPKP
jgi:photosystem II stability/assembly factor-like uncharacterized protein